MGGATMVGMKNTISDQIRHQQQLTLTLPGPALDACSARHRRLRRAAAWFTHMRHIVDLAPDPIESSAASNPQSESQKQAA